MLSNKCSEQETFFLLNSLAVLLKAVEGKRTTVDLRNEGSVYGTIERADGYMNVLMKDCVLTDPRGDRFSFEMFFVQARNIRYVHIPPDIPIIPAIKAQLNNLSVRNLPSGSTGRTFREKRAMKTQQEGKAAVERILADKVAKQNSNVEGK